MSIARRIHRLEHQVVPPADSPPYAIEQDAPGAPVRFYREGPVTWGASGPDEPVEMEPDEYRRRYVEPFPRCRPLTWSDQPWTADLFPKRQ